MSRSIVFTTLRRTTVAGGFAMLIATAAPASAAVRSVGTVRIETSAAVRIVDNANTQLELAHAGIVFAPSASGRSALAPTNFLVLSDARGRRPSTLRGSGAGTDRGDEALSVSVSRPQRNSSKVSGALTLILANYY